MKIIKESDQTYDRRKIADFIISSIIDDDRFFNIMAAYDSDVSTKESKQEVKKDFLELADEIIPELDGDYEFEDQVDEMLEDNKYLDQIKDIDSYYEYFGDNLQNQWKEEKDEQEREYRRSQGF